jgi:hypothetical protein
MRNPIVRPYYGRWVKAFKCTGCPVQLSCGGKVRERLAVNK